MRLCHYCMSKNCYFTGTVRKNRLTASATDSEIYNITKDWFRFASDREWGRKKREARKKMNEEKRKESEKEGNSNEALLKYVKLVKNNYDTFKIPEISKIKSISHLMNVILYFLIIKFLQ